MTMKEVYLCSDYLESHPLFKSFGSDLATLAEKDYPGKGYFEGKDIPSIDLDDFERKTKRSNDCTSDGAVGIADVSDSRMSYLRLLLTELRMDYENHKNLDFSNIRRKYVHSFDILQQYDPDKRIDSGFALIFSERTQPKAQRWIKSWSRESSKKEAANWSSYTPESFCNFINYGKTLPLRPLADTVAMVRDWSSRKEIGYDGFSVLAEKIEEYWTKLKNRYLLIDMRYLSDQMQEYLSKVAFPTGEEGELCRLLQEEVENMIRM